MSSISSTTTTSTMIESDSELSASPVMDSLNLGSEMSSCTSQCPTPRSILRLKSSRPGSACGCNKVRFSECIDEHQADDYDRSKCATAVPTFREIRELERIRRELCPDGRGISDQDVGNSGNESIQQEDFQPYFAFDDCGDVDNDDDYRRRPPPKRRLRGVPIELCPIFPEAGPSPTPANSHTPSPLNSPMISAFDKKPPSRGMMAFLPILTPESNSTNNAPMLLTPPETPTLNNLDLNDDSHDDKVNGDEDVKTRSIVQTDGNSGAPLFSSSTHIQPIVSSAPRPSSCRMAIMPVLASSSPKQTSTTTTTPTTMYTSTTSSSTSTFALSFKATTRS